MWTFDCHAELHQLAKVIGQVTELKAETCRSTSGRSRRGYHEQERQEKVGDDDDYIPGTRIKKKFKNKAVKAPKKVRCAPAHRATGHMTACQRPRPAPERDRAAACPALFNASMRCTRAALFELYMSQLEVLASCMF